MLHLMTGAVMGIQLNNSKSICLTWFALIHVTWSNMSQEFDSRAWLLNFCGSVINLHTLV